MSVLHSHAARPAPRGAGVSSSIGHATKVWSLLIFLATALTAEDVIVLRSGGTKSGVLKSCLDDRCTLGSAAISKGDLTWIGFDQGKERPPALAPSSADQVVLRDGTTRSGVLEGVSLGLVVLDGVELAREDVAWIRFADLSQPGTTLVLPSEGPPKGLDAVAMRQGAIRVGHLVACVGGSCLLEGEGRIARTAIAAIVFGGGEEAAVDSSGAGAEDRVLLRDGPPHESVVLAVDPDSVITAGRTFPRSAVAAVLFAEPAPSPAGPFGAPGNPAGGGEAPAPPGETGTPPAPPAPPSTPPPSQASAPGSPPPAHQMRRGALWTGVCRATYRTNEGGCRSLLRSTNEYRLREWEATLVNPYSSDPLRRIGRFMTLEPEGSVLKNEYELDCPEGSASGEGAITLSVMPNQEGYDHPSGIYFKDRESDLTPILGTDLPIGGSLYTIALSTRYEDRYPVTYRFEGAEPHEEMSAYLPCMIGKIPLIGGPVDPQVRSVDGGRMGGSFSVPWTNGTYAASWSLCREGTDCPPPPPLPSEPADPCARAGQEAAQSDTCEAQLDATLDELAPHLARYNELMASVEANRGAFQAALNYCFLYDSAKRILEAILTGGTGPAAEAAQALMALRDLIEKAQEGDLASLFYPESMEEVLAAYGQAKAVWFEMTADDLTKMQADLDGCSGKAPIDTMMNAKTFLTDLAAAKQVWDGKVAPGMNELRSRGLQCAGWEHAAWRACLADAACRGVPPDCGPEPSLDGAYD